MSVLSATSMRQTYRAPYPRFSNIKPAPASVGATAANPPKAQQAIDRAASALDRYRTLPAAQESAPPVGLERFMYGTNTAAALVRTPANRRDLVGGIGTPPEVAKLYEAGAANAFNPAFRKHLDQAIAANGGLGDAQNGYLAFSRELGFVRYRNPNFTPEQNRKLAAMSLQTGWPLERLPSRQHTNSTLDDPKMNKWVEEFTAKYAEKFAAFMADPSKGLELKDGSRNRYYLAADPASGQVFSQTARLKGGLAGFAQKHMNILGPVLNVASVVAAPFAPYLSAGIQMLKTGMTSLVTGKFGVSQALSLVGAIPGVGAFFQANPIAAAAAGTIANGIDTGKFKFGSLLNAVGAQYLSGLPGGEIVDRGAQALLGVASKKLNGEKLDLLGIAREFGPMLKAVGKETSLGDFTKNLSEKLGADPSSSEGWADRLREFIGDKDARDNVAAGISALYGLVKNGRISPDDSARLAEKIGLYLLTNSEWGQRRLAELAAEQKADSQKAA